MIYSAQLVYSRRHALASFAQRWCQVQLDNASRRTESAEEEGHAVI
jgi:hypothetical protein